MITPLVVPASGSPRSVAGALCWPLAPVHLWRCRASLPPRPGLAGIVVELLLTAFRFLEGFERQAFGVSRFASAVGHGPVPLERSD